MNKFTHSLAVLAAFMIALPMGAFAQTAGGLKIAVVDINRVLGESPQLEAARTKLEDEFRPRERELQSMAKALEEKQARFEKDAPVMGAEQREAAQRDFGNEQRAFARAQQQYQEDRELRNNEVLREIQQELVRQVQEFGAAEGYDLIMVEGIIYASDRVNVTPQILERLKASYDGKKGS